VIVLLHPLGMSAGVWDEVIALLDDEAVAPKLLGHRGGAPPRRRPIRIDDLVDDVERQLDERGIGRAHIVGNSLGGWVAIELARRGRALTVTAFSPAGSWTAGTEEQTFGARKIRRTKRLAQVGRALPMRLVLRSASARRQILRDVATRGDRLGAREVYEATRDLLGCVVLEDILTTAEELAPLEELPCPITLAWSGADRLLPLEVNGVVAGLRIPAADVVVLKGVGHVPMIDNPDLVARTIAQAAMSTTMREPPVSPF
jgi:pimeloyl-ACP methyl ester carboxylesterase